MSMGFSPPPRFPSLLSEGRRGDLGRVDDYTIKPTRVHGFVLTEGAGEALHDVAFPVTFTERPAMSFGAELDENEFVVALSMPTVSVVVVAWAKTLTERVGGGEREPGWYVGATLAIVTTGKAEQRMWVHWQAEAKAMRDPVHDASDPTQAL